MIREFWQDYDEGKFWDNLKRVNKRHHYLNTIVESKINGFPFSVKDLIVTKGVETTASSRILKGWVPDWDATVVERMRKHGTLIGKNNCDAWGFGSFNLNTAFEVPTNPHDEERVTGGSSGGSAGLVAALPEPTISIATSTGGSIENPSSFCGTVGFVPTYGRVPRYGLISYADSLDKIGVIAKTVEDAELGFSIISGKDPRDMTSHDKKSDIPIRRVGIVKEFMDVDTKIRDRFEEIVQDLGLEVLEISLEKTFKYGVMSYYIIAMAEASTNLAKYCGMRYGIQANPEGKHFDEYFSDIRTEGFGTEAKRRIMLGTFVRSEGYRNRYYKKAVCVRNQIIEEYKKAFKSADVLLHPTMPMVAPKFSEVQKLSPAEVYMMDILTVGPNLAGIPHGTVPIQKSGLPFGLTVNGPWGADEKVLEFMKRIEVLAK